MEVIQSGHAVDLRDSFADELDWVGRKRTKSLPRKQCYYNL